MFNQEVLKILQELNAVTNSVILKYPETVAVAETGDIQVYFDISTVSPEFPDIGLKDSLNELLSLVKLFPEDRVIDVKDNTISVKSGRQSSTFISSNIALMDMYDKDPEQFNKTESAPSVAVFEITTDDMKNIKSAGSVFKDLSEVIFESKDGEINVSLGATNKFGARNNTYSITKDANCSKEFQIKIPVENFKVIPNSNYQVQVKYNSSRDSYRILMLNETLKSIKIMLSVKI